MNQTQTQTNMGTIPTTKDHSYITKLPTFADRGAAIAKRLESIKADKKYQALPEDKKAKVREDLYNKYVPASYSGFHLPVPDKDTWVGATGRDTSFKVPKTPDEKLSDTYKDPRNKQFGQDFMVGASKFLDGVSLFGAKIANKTFSKMFNLDGVVSHPDDSWLDKSAIHAVTNTKRVLDNFEDAQKAKIQSDDFWLQTHPRDTKIGRLASDSGEMIASLPLYEAIGAFQIGARGLNVAGKVLPLTAKLVSTPTGKFVAKRLISATDFYLATLAGTGGNKQQAAGSAVAGAVAESALGGVGKLAKIAAAPLIKKWTANTIAMGGIPFAQDVAQSAMHEMEHVDNWFLKPANLLDLTIGKNHELTHGIMVHPASDTTGHFTTADGGVWSYGSRETQQKGYEELVRRAEAQRVEHDPVMAKLHEGEKVSLESTAQIWLKKSVKELSIDERKFIFGKRLEQINQAAAEAPVHLPDLHKQEVEASIVQQRQTNPVLNGFMSKLEQQGVKFTDAVVENNTKQIAEETGIANTQGATKKLAKATRKVSGNISEKGFASHKVDSIAYFKNPRNRVAVADAVSDRSKAGLNKFIDVLKQADGGKITFEDQTHRMLFHYGNRKSLPESVANSLLYRIRQVKGYENKTAPEIQKEADWLHVHLLEMAKGGQLTSEKNVFRSSEFAGGPMSWSKWQKQLASENDQVVIKGARKALARHPHALQGFDATVKQIQQMSFNAKTPEEYLTYKRAIQESSLNIVQHKKDRILGGLIQ